MFDIKIARRPGGAIALWYARSKGKLRACGKGPCGTKSLRRMRDSCHVRADLLEFDTVDISPPSASLWREAGAVTIANVSPAALQRV